MIRWPERSPQPFRTLQVPLVIARPPGAIRDLHSTDQHAGRETSVITSKPASRDQVKTGHYSETKLFYPACGSAGKLIFVRQLRGPHLSTCPWCKRRSSMALTAAASASILPQSSTGRFEVTSVLARS